MTSNVCTCVCRLGNAIQGETLQDAQVSASTAGKEGLRIQVLLSFYLSISLSICLHLLHIRYPYVSISPHPGTPIFLSVSIFFFLSVFISSTSVTPMCLYLRIQVPRCVHTYGCPLRACLLLSSQVRLNPKA